jgi:hypothetical protein
MTNDDHFMISVEAMPASQERRGYRRVKLGLTQSWCRDRSAGADEARLKQIDLSTTVHLPFDELELRDLTLGLSV